MVWDSPRGVTVQWTALGEGCTDLAELARSVAFCREVLGLGTRPG